MSPRLFFNAIQIRNKNVYFHGAVLAFFTISVIYTFITGCKGFAALSRYSGSLGSGNVTLSDYYDSGDMIESTGGLGDISGSTGGFGRLLDFFDPRYLAATTKPTPSSN